VELSVRTGDGEANQLAATVCFHATTAICKSNPDFVSFDHHGDILTGGSLLTLFAPAIAFRTRFSVLS